MINLKNGIDKLLFGMKQKDVEALYGKADKQFNDDDGNVISLYNDQKWSLTFYEDEDFRLGYIICSHPELTILNKKVIGKNIEEIKTELPFTSWDKDDIDITENHFNESNWLILQSEYNEVTRVEIGAIINDDEFDWKFKA
jgi:NifB/MoaA-like Fe-S oxidoreductase